MKSQVHKLCLLAVIFAIFILTASCDKQTIPLIPGDPFWQKTNAADNVSFMDVIKHTSGVLVAVSGDYAAAAQNDGYAWRSEDNGLTWQGIPVGPQAVARVIQKGDQLVAAGSNGLWISSDTGKTWSLRGLDSLKIWDVSVATEDPSVMAASSSGGVFLSRDDGRSWKRISDRADFRSVLLLSADVIFAGKFPGLGADLYVSRDGGIDWQIALGGVAVTNLHRTDSGLLFAAGWASDEWAGGCYLSSDAGTTWKLIFDQTSSVRDLLVYKRDWYICGYRTAVQKSSDSGQSWQRLDAGLDSDWITGLALSSDNHLIAISDLGGIYRSAAPLE